MKVKLLHAIGDAIYFGRRQVGPEAAGQDFGRAGDAQDIDDAAIDQAGATGGERQGIDGIERAGADMAAENGLRIVGCLRHLG